MINLNMVVVFEVLVDNKFKKLCFKHAVKYALQGIDVTAETDESQDVDYNKSKYYCCECK